MVIKDLRGKAGNWFVKILLVLIILSFMMFGIQGYFQSTYSGDVVAKVDGTTISKAYVKHRLQEALKQFGGSISLEKALKMGFGRLVLDEIITEILIQKEIERLKLTVGEKSINLALRLAPTFHEAGKGFSPQKLKDFLARSGMNEKALLAEIRKNIMQQQLFSALSMPVTLSEAFSAPLFEGLVQERDIDIIFYNQKNIPLKLKTPSDAELKAYYEEHGKDFQTEEKRKISVLTIDPLKLVEGRTFSKEELEATYEQHIAEFSTPEKRHVVVASLSSEKEYEALKKALMRGETPRDLLDLGLKTADSLDTAIAGAAFSLKQGGISTPVKTANGLKVVQVKAIKAPVIHPLTAVKDRVIERAKREEGQKVMTELVSTIEDQIAGGGDIKALAKTHHLTLLETGLETRQMLESKGLPKNVLDQAFQQDAKVDGQLIDLDNGKVSLVKVNDVAPAVIPPLESIKSLLQTAYMAANAEKTLIESAQIVADAYNKGTSLSQIAKERGNPAHLTPKHLPKVNRLILMEGAKMDKDLVQKIFSLPLNRATVEKVPGGAMLVIIKKIHTPSLAKNKKEFESFNKGLSQTVSTEQMKAFIAYLKEKFNVEINEKVLDTLGEE